MPSGCLIKSTPAAWKAAVTARTVLMRESAVPSSILATTAVDTFDALDRSACDQPSKPLAALTWAAKISPSSNDFFPTHDSFHIACDHSPSEKEWVCPRRN